MHVGLEVVTAVPLLARIASNIKYKIKSGLYPLAAHDMSTSHKDHPYAK